MKKNQLTTTHAFIDAANLHTAIKRANWDIDYARLRIWLTDALHVDKAYLFIGLIPQNYQLYHDLQEAGYELVFKPTITDPDGGVKGNCDADLVLEATRGYYEDKYDKAVIISSDGDFHGLVRFLKKKGVLKTLISPSRNCSILLKRLNTKIVYLDEIKPRLVKNVTKKKRPPLTTGHQQGSLRGNTKSVAKNVKKVNVPQLKKSKNSPLQRRAPSDVKPKQSQKKPSDMNSVAIKTKKKQEKK
ncbi:MAG: NYN domain-containing protein [Bdellovibrionales bacterium]|nr:NYN domain-containing protein [Bdellovibrionales bacterium]